MREMIFFSNPECVRSIEKRTQLESAGNTILWKDLTSHNWTYEELLPFLRGRTPLDIMNSSAPDIQTGKIDPLILTFEQALNLLAEKPVLIKGPLIRVDNLHIQGLQDRRLNKYLDHKVRCKSAASVRKNTPKAGKATKRWQRQYTDHPGLSYSFA